MYVLRKYFLMRYGLFIRLLYMLMNLMNFQSYLMLEGVIFRSLKYIRTT